MTGAPSATLAVNPPFESVVAVVHETRSTSCTELPYPALEIETEWLPELAPRLERTVRSGALEMTISVDELETTVAWLVWYVEEALPAAERIELSLFKKAYIGVVVE